MNDRIASLERTVALLAADLADVRERLATLELSEAAAAVVEPPTPIPEIQPATIQNWMSLTGRTLLVLGGAYLLRALTSAQVVPVPVGVALGLLYGAPWLVLASRAARRGATADAFSHGVATALIGYPLVWEATVRFAVVTPGQSAALLLLLTAAALVLSAMESLYSLAAIVACGAMLSSLGLGFMTQQWLPYSLLATAVGLGTLWIGYLRSWILLRWPAAFVANLLLFVVPLDRSASPRAVVFAHLFVLGGYLGSIAVRTLRLPRVVLPFEAIQSAAALGFGVGGLILYAYGNATALTGIGIAALVVAATTYALAVLVVQRRESVLNLLYYSLVGLVFAITGGLLVFGAFASLLFGACAVVACVYGRGRDSIVALTQTAIYLLAAGASSGLLLIATAALGAPIDSWIAMQPLAAFALAATAVSAFLLPSDTTTAGRSLRILVFSLFIWSAVGMTMASVGTILPAAAADAAWLSTLRTILLVAATFVVANVRGDAGRLTYPLLIITGMKLAAMDFPQGRPVTLFFVLALYGIALIVAPRVRRRRVTDLPRAVASSIAQHETAAAG
jgi:hypothetical protein